MELSHRGMAQRSLNFLIDVKPVSSEQEKKMKSEEENSPLS